MIITENSGRETDRKPVKPDPIYDALNEAFDTRVKLAADERYKMTVRHGAEIIAHDQCTQVIRQNRVEVLAAYRAARDAALAEKK